jgi:hypothetical protein
MVFVHQSTSLTVGRTLPVRTMGYANSAGKIVLPLDVVYVNNAYGNDERAKMEC